MVLIGGISTKKKFGQHFLRDQSVVDSMLAAVSITPQSSIFEIGCGDGFLTRSILATHCARLWVFEIDPAWADYVQKYYPDPRMMIFQEDIIQVDFARFQPHAPWLLLANLPYQITFPLLYRLHEFRHLLQEAVVMMQEEVAQKLTKQSGRGYGIHALFFQYYFTVRLLTKVPPSAFVPPPKIYSRLVYLKPKMHVVPIAQEDAFWRFIKFCFAFPRRTLKNNLAQTHYGRYLESMEFGNKRAQEMCMDDFLALWEHIRMHAA